MRRQHGVADSPTRSEISATDRVASFLQQGQQLAIDLVQVSLPGMEQSRAAVAADSRDRSIRVSLW